MIINLVIRIKRLIKSVGSQFEMNYLLIVCYNKYLSSTKIIN